MTAGVARTRQAPRVTERRLQLLREIQAATTEKGYAPSVRELALRMGIRTQSTVKGQLNALREVGLVTWEDEKPRTLQVTELGRKRLEISSSDANDKED